LKVQPGTPSQFPLERAQTLHIVRQFRATSAGELREIHRKPGGVQGDLQRGGLAESDEIFLA